MTSGESLLRFEGATRVFGAGDQAVRALGPVDLDIRRGEFVAVMGPSGSGKTTLMSLAGALDVASAGRVLWHGRDLAELGARAASEFRRRFVGFVFQDLNLLPGLTALENVALPLELDGVPLRRARSAASEALTSVGLGSLAARFPDDLSGGERQRVAIARARVGPRELVLADEPTGSLDSLNGELVMRELRQQCEEGLTAIVVTHDASHAAWADRVVHLRDGRVVDAAPRARILDQPAGSRR